MWLSIFNADLPKIKPSMALTEKLLPKFKLAKDPCHAIIKAKHVSFNFENKSALS